MNDNDMARLDAAKVTTYRQKKRAYWWRYWLELLALALAALTAFMP